MFISKKKHERIVGALEGDVAVWRRNYDKQFLAADRARVQRDEFKRQLDAATAELSRLRAAREKGNANLRGARKPAA